MGLLTKAFRNAASGASSMRVPWPTNVNPTPGGGYQAYARAYSGNEIVYAAVKLLATSAAEPHIIGKRWRRNKAQIRAQSKAWASMRIPNRAGEMMQDSLLVRNGFIEELTDHPLVHLLNNPNPYMSRGQLWSTVTMDRQLAGNSYLLKARGSLGNVGELWRLRPDRIKIIPGANGDRSYEYRVGNEVVTFKAEDVCHFKEPNPYDEYYGMPPLLPAMGRVTIDNYMRHFLQTFFERGGTGPGSILTVEGDLAQDAKDDIKDRMQRQLGGPSGFHEMLVFDNTKTTYQRLGLDRGLRDALPKEIDAVNEARIAMVFGIPGSILGLLIGYESSSYANKRQDWQVLWDVTMTPLLSDYDDVLNLSLVPEFAGIDEVCFDLSEIKALQEDVDAIHKRARDNVTARIWTLEFARELTGVGEAEADEHYLLPDGTAVRSGDLDKEPELPEPAEAPELLMPAVAARIGRTPLLLDSGARTIWEKDQANSRENPRLTLEVRAGMVGVSVSTLKRYSATFGQQT